MPRPRKLRLLTGKPHPAVYKPAGVPLNGLRQVILLYEELEALRLADLEGLSQVESARQMGISRSTFQRILSRARRQITLALVEGQALRVEGGTFEIVAPSSHRLRFRRDAGGE